MLRATTGLARRSAPLVARRSASSTAHTHDDHHHHEQDDIVYPKEGFGAPIWRNTLFCIIGGTLFYEYLGAPAENDRPWLPSVTATQSSWADIALTRAAKETALAEERQLVRSAKRPPIYRARNPEDFANVSPYGNAVGLAVNWGPGAGKYQRELPKVE
ncbi:hypothetical protein FB45DRAFT_782232 [Roridomyces roridus]|uniref:Uncharacterized protein n=1 Tax=Roridomyces roridus TaxID=1738132 RepID=A0AAD7FZC8_9AGAR|nr:hypothetical protein FB45DRAFT_782232 [Roridomyces roridus]